MNFSIEDPFTGEHGSFEILAFFDNETSENATVNSSINGNATSFDDKTTTINLMIKCLVFGTIIVLTIIGNLFVITAILWEKCLRKVANYLIVSLAVADLFIGCIVMPICVAYEIKKGWVFGIELCDFWTTCDILCCSASILNLVAIAFDRYWAVTNLSYIQTRNCRSITTMIVAAWTISLVVALAPQFGWKDPDYQDRVIIRHVCIPSVDLGYQMFSYSTTLFIPLPVIVVLYWKIYQTARKSFRWRREQRKAGLINCKKVEKHKMKENKKGLFDNLKKRLFVKTSRENCEAAQELVTSHVSTEGPSTSSTVDAIEVDTSINPKNTCLPKATTYFNRNTKNSEKNYCNQSPKNFVDLTSARQYSSTTQYAELPKPSQQKRKESTISLALSTIRKSKNTDQARDHDVKKEKKTAKILAIITGAFAVCWIPFFTLNFLTTRYEYQVNPFYIGLFGWLAYSNSTINPIIYTLFSPEFRQAFKTLLCGVSGTRKRGTKL